VERCGEHETPRGPALTILGPLLSQLSSLAFFSAEDAEFVNRKLTRRGIRALRPECQNARRHRRRVPCI
jgi:hypothetical protein